MRREARASRGRSPSHDRARPRGARRSARRAVRSAQGHRIRPLRLRSRGAGALGGVALVRQRGPARPGERDAQGAVRRPGGAGQAARAALARLPPRRAGRPHPRGGGGALLRRRAAAHRARRGAGRVRHPRRGQAGQRDRRRSPADQRRSDALRGAAAPRRRGLLQRAELLRSPARFAGLAGAGGGALGERTVFRVGPRRPGDEQRGALCRGSPARRAGHLGSAQRRRGAPALGGAGQRGRGAGDRAAPRRCAHRAGSGKRLAARVRVRAGVPARAGAPAARAARGRARVEGTGARPRRGRPVWVLALGPGRPPGRGLDPPRGVDLRGRLRPDPQRAGTRGRLARPVGRQSVRHRPLGAAGTRAAALPHQPPGDHRRFRRLQRRARGDLLMRAVLLGALAACAASAGALDDPMFYLHDDTYQLTPARLAQWEAGQLAQRGNAWIDLGSIEGGEYDAVERGVVNLDLASRFSLHAELRNDRDSQGRVTRAVADLLVNVAPGLWLGASGVPAARKQDYGVGGSVLVASASRRRYLLARVVADQFLYNRTNLDGGTRASPVLHAQAQGRWEEGAWSVAGSVDATTESETSFPGAPLVTFEAGSRRELSLHGRYAVPALELDARLDVLRTHEARTQLGASSALRDDDGVPYRLTRREPGARIAAQRDDGSALWELGYALALPVLRRTGVGPAVDSAPYEDKLYGSCDVSLGPLSLRALLSWEIRNARFGGANANVLMQF